MANQNVFRQLANFHPYWTRNHTEMPEMLPVDVKKGDLVLAPFGGAGIFLLGFLFKGAHVVAGNPDPAAALLMRTLVQPVGLFALRQSFRQVSRAVSEEIQKRYTITCPGCRKPRPFAELVWKKGARAGFRPDTAAAACNTCGWKGKIKLTGAQAGRQLKLSRTEPSHWFPQNHIPGMGDNGGCSVTELYTCRSLASLADLHHGITALPAGAVRDVLVAVFLSVALRCVGPVMLPGNRPRVGKGAAEVNVWQAFEEQFQLMARIRQDLNAALPSIRIADTLNDFQHSDDAVYIEQSACRSFPIPRQRKATHVFFNLPVSLSDEDLFVGGLQAAWLNATVDPAQLGGHSNLHDENWNIRIAACMEKVIQHTGPDCRIIVFRHAATNAAEATLRSIIAAAGCSLQEIQVVPAAFGYASGNRSKGKYYILARQPKPAKTEITAPLAENEADELRMYMRAAAFCEKMPEGKAVAGRLFAMLRDNLKLNYAGMTRRERKTVTADASLNQKAFARLCRDFLTIILAPDHYRIVAGRRDRFDQTETGIVPDLNELEAVGGSLKICDAVARNDAGQQIFFCFYEPEKEEALKKFAARVYREDRQRFDQVCYLIFADRTQMDQCRQVAWADNWPRGFFICFSDLLRQASRLRPERFGNRMEQVPARSAGSRKQAVKHFTAEVLRNSPVGADGNPLHYKLQFRTDDMRNIGPGQFIMVDPLSTDRRKQADRIRHANIFGTSRSGSPVNKKDFSPHSYLKRPFGVQRVYYRHFEWGYHANLSLPPMLAGITHTVFPHRFEMLYKVIDGGIGTPEMTGLQQGERLKVLGPLGRYTHIPDWRFHGIETVHLVGGGVGMAPLVFFGQALKFYSFRVKAFIGIDRMASLAESQYGRTFSEEAGKEYVYIEELSRIGLRPDEIFLSREYMAGEQLSDKIATENYHCGLVTEQYRSVLARAKHRQGTLIIACGPKPMMIALKDIADAFGMPMKVLLEKRMGCGIGVCMSCVCRTQKNNTKQYSRVCVDGPIFDAEDIDWGAL